MTSEEANKGGGALFDAEDYTTWCRRLYQHVPKDGSTHILFDSTISEPTELLRQVVTRAFGASVSDRFVSVFGQGNGYLIDALAKRYRVNADQIVCSTGATNAITMALRALPADKRRVAVETPRLDVLHHAPKALGYEIGEIERHGETFDIDPDQFRRVVRPGVGMIILTNPHNPSGAILSVDRLRQLAALAEQAGALVLVDEVYSDLARDAGFVSASAIAPNMISANSLTKSFGLFSLRCGWLLAAPRIARDIEAANARLEFGASKLAHAVAAHVLEDMTPFDAYWRDVLAANRPILEKHVGEMMLDGLVAGDIPRAGCMYFPRIVDTPDTATLARKLWEENRVLVAPGEFFGQAGRIRLGFGVADARLDAGLSRLHEALHTQRRSTARRRAPRAAASVQRIKAP
jgi:aspartate/methionine/tyrosine aminotransferase